MWSGKDFNALKKNLKKNTGGFKKIRVALLGDSATQLLSLALRATGINSGLDIEIFEADFNQVERQVFDPGSELYDYKPAIVIIFRSAHQLLSKYNKLNPGNPENLAVDELRIINGLVSHISFKLDAKVLYYNYTEINDSVFGNYANKTESSFLFQLRKLNFELMNYAVSQKNFFLIDISSLQNRVGKTVFFNTPVYINTEMVLSLAALPEVASITLDTILAMEGRFKKCVILDLDNTLWGGIIGDDGLENIQLGSLGIGKAFTQFQYWLKKLKNRGILLAVCSKNTEAVAKEPFERHPDMVLHLEDIAVFVANWETKVDNIRYIQKILNIGFDTMVFLDDNPFERNMVREQISLLTIPELPEDPADYLEYLYQLNLFETVSFSEEDKQRTAQYQVEAQRTEVQKLYYNEDDYLASLGMVAVVEQCNTFNIPRVAQLSQRSNQFNLRTIRYTEAEIEALSGQPDVIPLTFTLKDKFGDNGLIGVVVMKKENTDILFIENWFMSCRVLKRGMENFILNALAGLAIEKGFSYLKGEYIPTGKNDMVKNHYQDLGFISSGNDWLLELKSYQNRKTLIKDNAYAKA